MYTLLLLYVYLFFSFVFTYLYVYLSGNANLNRLTSMGNTELRVDVINFNRKRAYAKYSVFRVANVYNQYRLSVSGYSGNAGKVD